jgi:hypothetical protein
MPQNGLDKPHESALLLGPPGMRLEFRQRGGAVARALDGGGVGGK